MLDALAQLCRRRRLGLRGQQRVQVQRAADRPGRAALAQQNRARQLARDFSQRGFELQAKNERLGAADVDAVRETLLHDGRVDHRALGANLGHAQPGNDKLGAVLHEERHGVAARDALAQQQVRQLVAERVDFGKRKAARAAVVLDHDHARLGPVGSHGPVPEVGDEVVVLEVLLDLLAERRELPGQAQVVQERRLIVQHREGCARARVCALARQNGGAQGARTHAGGRDGGKGLVHFGGSVCPTAQMIVAP